LTLSKVVNEVKFTKPEKNDNDQTNSQKNDQNDQNDHFCEVCVLGKVHKMHSKTSAAHRTKTTGERLHSDLFEGEETLSDVEGFRYEIIVIDDHTRMKFLIILKSKDEIVEKIRALFNKVETHTGRKIRFFRTDDGREFYR
jgi:hypothetical protein